MNQNKITGFDFIRAFSVFFVFMAHIITKNSENQVFVLVIRAISPGITMSLLGFISGYLLSSKDIVSFNGGFYIKRFSRIYVALFVCLTVVVAMHIILSYNVICQHSLIHFMGLSFFMELFQVKNNSSIGAGLWFITIINIMYLALPIIVYIYSHKNKTVHLVFAIVVFLFLNQVMSSATSAWNVIIAFNIGCYAGISSSIKEIYKRSMVFYVIATFSLFVLSAFATSNVIFYEVRSFLFPLYPVFVAPLLLKIGNKIKGKLANYN